MVPESLSLFPFLSLLPPNGNGGPFSVPFSLSSSSKRERRAFLCSLFPLFFLQTVTESLSLLPFPSLLPPNGNGGPLSVPFSLSSSSKRERRAFLCSLFPLFFLQTGTEGLSLFPIPSLLPSNGNGEPFSVPFPLSSPSKRERGSLSIIFPLTSFSPDGIDNGSCSYSSSNHTSSTCFLFCCLFIFRYSFDLKIISKS